MTGAPEALRQALSGGEPVADWGAGLRRTRVVRTGTGRYLWCLSWPARAAGAYDAGPVDSAVSTPTLVDGEYVYPTYGADPLASWMIEARPDRLEVAKAAFATVLPAVAALHSHPSPPLSVPPAVTRLLSYLEDPAAGTAGTARLRELTGRHWGEQVTTTLAAWARRLTTPHTPVRVHGGLSTGVVVPGEPPRPTVVLSEPVPCTGAPELDLGWLLGELLERAVFPATPDDVEVVRTLQHEILRGYPGRWALEEVAMAATLRIALHAHDFVTHQGWRDDIRGLVALCRKLTRAVLARDERLLVANVLGGYREGARR